MTLLAGIALAARVGVHAFAWVRLALVGMVLIGILGAMTRRRARSYRLVRFSLLTRTALALVIVYLMIAKPELRALLIVISAALGIALAASMPNGHRPALDVNSSDGNASMRHDQRTNFRP